MEIYQAHRRARRIKQSLSALVFVGILAFGWRYPVLGYFIPLCMLLGIAVGLRRGRAWCNWYCPRGSFYDAFVSAISPRRAISPFFRGMVTRTAVLVILMSVMTFQLVRHWPDPFAIGAAFVTLVTVTTVTGVILALFFHQRTWCFLCPIGTVLRVIGKNRYPLTIDSGLCIECKRCAEVCPVQIKPYLYKDKGARPVRDGDCLKCGSCVAACPKKALRLG